jgi:cytochrome c oxidase subunit II
MFPESATTIGPKIDQLYQAVLLITGFFFFLVQGGLLLFILKYRDKPGRKAAYVHGNNTLEIIWTVVPALILVGLTIASQEVWAQIRSPQPGSGQPVQVEILAEQFAWNVRYPGPDGQLETSDDITAINQLHLPIGRTAQLSLRSKDVIHSFFVPEFRVKQDVVPGLTTKVWMDFTRTGMFDIRCAELCGLGHYRMRGFATVESPQKFQAWLEETKADE